MQGKDNVLLRDREVAELLTVSRPTVHRWVKEGRLPKPIKLGPMIARWRLADIEQVIHDRAADSSE